MSRQSKLGRGNPGKRRNRVRNSALTGFFIGVTGWEMTRLRFFCWKKNQQKKHEQKSGKSGKSKREAGKSSEVEKGEQSQFGEIDEGKSMVKQGKSTFEV